MRKKNKLGFSVLDIVLLVLIAACVLSTVFREQVRSFLGEKEVVLTEVTFLVEHVTEGARNRPVSGEEIVLTETGLVIGSLASVSESKKVYESTSDPDETVEISTLTCKMLSETLQKENGYFAGGVMIKPGVTLSVETKSASFEMIVTMVKASESKD